MVMLRSDVFEETFTSCVSYPTIENTNVADDSETFKLKLPSLSETVPSTLPLTNMFTPIRPPLSSDTFPDIEIFCEKDWTETVVKNRKSQINFLTKLFIHFIVLMLKFKLVNLTTIK